MDSSPPATRDNITSEPSAAPATAQEPRFLFEADDPVEEEEEGEEEDDDEDEDEEDEEEEEEGEDLSEKAEIDKERDEGEHRVERIEEQEEEAEAEEEEEEEEEDEEEGEGEEQEPGSKSSSPSLASSRSGVPRSSSASSPALSSASVLPPSAGSAHKRVRQMIRDPIRKISLPDKALPFLRRTTPSDTSVPQGTSSSAAAASSDPAPRRKLGVFSRPPVFNGLFQRNTSAPEPPPLSPPSDGRDPSSSPGVETDSSSPRHKTVGASTFSRIFSKPIQRSRSAGSSEAPAHALFLRQGKSKASGSVSSCTNGGGGAGATSPKTAEICVYEGEKAERKKKRSIGQDVRQRLSLFRRQGGGGGSMPCRHATDTERILKASLPDEESVRRWSDSFDALLQDKYGLALFHSFLKTEFSEENIEFWIACEEYKNISTTRKLHSRAQKIYNDYIAVQAPQEVNLDSNTRVQTIRAINTPSRHTFDQAQKRIQALMDKDSYQRFLRSDLYVALLREVTEAAAAAATSNTNSTNNNNNNNNNESSSGKNISAPDSPRQSTLDEPPSSTCPTSLPTLPVEGDSTA